MPRLIVMSELVLRCQRRADKEFDDQIASAEWKSLISEIVGELRSEVDLASGRVSESTSTITATGAASYTLPADHQSTIRFDRVESDGSLVPLRELERQEEDLAAGLPANDASAFMVVNGEIFFFPNPTSGSYRLRYIPQADDLSAALDADQVDVFTADGLAFVINGVAALALSKSESDVRYFEARKGSALERVQVWAANQSMDGHRRTAASDVDAPDPLYDGRFR